MTVRTFGFAHPLTYADVKPGMLLSAQHGDRQVFGLAFQGDREILVAVFLQSGSEESPPLPYVLDLSDIHQALSAVDGEREFEPSEGADFSVVPKARTLKDGFVLSSTGRVGLAVSFNHYGSKNWKVLDFETGEDLAERDTLAMLPPSRLLIHQPGREQRRELLIKAAG